MIANTDQRVFDVVEVTNELPRHRTGGVGTVIENLMAALPRQDLRVLWYLTDHAYLPGQVRSLLERFPNVAVGSYEELSEFRARVLHLHAYQENGDLRRLLSDRKAVCTIHSLLALEEQSNEVDLTGAVAWQESVMELCDTVVLISEAEHRQYRALEYDRLNPRVRVIHNGVGRCAPFHSPRGKRVLGYCGRLVPRKHPEYIQMILAEPGFENRMTFVAGRGFSLYARELLQRLDLRERVRFLGWCAGPRLEAFFDAIDLLAVPSSYEPFGLVALEAIARGVPVVCTRVDGLSEVLGDVAFYCEDSSYEAFREAVAKWDSTSRQELEELALRGRERFQNYFTDDLMAKRYADLFRELMA